MNKLIVLALLVLLCATLSNAAEMVNACVGSERSSCNKACKDVAVGECIAFGTDLTYKLTKNADNTFMFHAYADDSCTKMLTGYSNIETYTCYYFNGAVSEKEVGKLIYVKINDGVTAAPKPTEQYTKDITFCSSPQVCGEDCKPVGFGECMENAYGWSTVTQHEEIDDMFTIKSFQDEFCQFRYELKNVRIGECTKETINKLKEESTLKYYPIRSPVCGGSLPEDCVSNCVDSILGECTKKDEVTFKLTKTTKDLFTYVEYKDLTCGVESKTRQLLVNTCNVNEEVSSNRYLSVGKAVGPLPTISPTPKPSSSSVVAVCLFTTCVALLVCLL